MFKLKKRSLAILSTSLITILAGASFYLGHGGGQDKHIDSVVQETIQNQNEKKLLSSDDQVIDTVNREIVKVDKPLESQQNSNKIIMKKSDTRLVLTK